MRKIILDTIAVLHVKEKQRAVVLMLMDVFISAADIAFLALLLYIVQYYSNTGAAGGPSFLRRWFPDRHSALLIAAFFLLFSVKNLAGFLVYRAQCRLVFRVASRISRENLTRYLTGDYAAYVNVDSSAHVREIGYDPSEFAQHVLGGLLQIVTQSVLILLTIAAIVLFNAQLFVLLLVILLPPTFALLYFLRRKRKGMKDRVSTSNEKSLQHLQEALAGYVESNIFQKNEVFLHRYMAYHKEFNGYILEQMIVQGIPNRLIEIFALLGVVILLMIQGKSGDPGNGTFITVGVLLAGAYKIIPGIVRILNLGGQVQAYAFCVRRTGKNGNIDPCPEEGQTPGFVELIRSIEFNRVRFSYNGKPVLDNLSWEMAPGDFLGISGRSGKGKTTILNILLGFLTPEEAEIRINQVPTDTGSRRRYWERISYVKQQTFLVHDTILHNITLQENGHAYDERRLKEAVRAAGLTDLINSFPERLDKVVMENGRNLSGGQKQRIAIARALYREADLYLLDEPFNELDETSECALLHHFRSLARSGKMVILITHNKKSLSFCNKTLSLDEA